MTENATDPEAPELPGAGGTEPPKPEPEGKERGQTRYRILWAEPPEDDSDDVRKYREIRNPAEDDGAYVASSASTAKRRAFEDEETEAHPFIQTAVKRRGVELRHVPMESWGPDEVEPTIVETTESFAWGTGL